jgi:hypothetical protein
MWTGGIISTFAGLIYNHLAFNVSIKSLDDLHQHLLMSENHSFNGPHGRDLGTTDTFCPDEVEQYRRQPKFLYQWHHAIFDAFEAIEFEPSYWPYLCEMKVIRDYFDYPYQCTLPTSERV